MNYPPRTMAMPPSLTNLSKSNGDRSPPGKKRSNFQYQFTCKKLINGKRVESVLKFNLDCFREEFKGSYGSTHNDTIIDYRDIHYWRGEENGVMVEYGRHDTIDHYETSHPDKILLAVQKIMEERERREKLQPGSVHGRRLSMTAQKVMDDLHATDSQDHVDGLEIFSDEKRAPANWDQNGNVAHARRRTSLLSGLANITLNINKAIAAEPTEHTRKMSTTDMSMVVQAAIGRNGTNKTIAEHDTQSLSRSRIALRQAESINSLSGPGVDEASQSQISINQLQKQKSDIWNRSGYTEELESSQSGEMNQPVAESEKKGFKMPTAPTNLRRSISSSTNALKKRISSSKPPKTNPSRTLHRQRSEVSMGPTGRQRSDTGFSLKRSVSPNFIRSDRDESMLEDLTESLESVPRKSSGSRLSLTMTNTGMRRTASMLELDGAIVDPHELTEVRFDDEKPDSKPVDRTSTLAESVGGLASIPSISNMGVPSTEVEQPDTEPHNEFHVTGGESVRQQASPTAHRKAKSPTLYQRKLGKTMATTKDEPPKNVGNVTTRSGSDEVQPRFVNPLDRTTTKTSSDLVFICRAKNPSKQYALRDVKLTISRSTGEIRLYNMEEREIGLIFPHKVRKLSSTPATVTFHFKDKKKMLLYTPEGDVIEDRISIILRGLGHYIEVDQKSSNNLIDLPFGLR